MIKIRNYKQYKIFMSNHVFKKTAINNIENRF